MPPLLKLIVNDYGWIHLSLGLFGNVAFFAGSILFLPAFEAYKVTGVWLFIGGAFFMLLGSIGKLLVDITEKPKHHQRS
ncbi:YrhK family protein [Alteromonas lipotrueiana]|uniref:YrhK family protein n=1 Tax=Alteromonas lipotrueiana TaxID=2803815 RepID=UPI001C4505CC|nr:YrhK family protein [Alteromonas lipotrueiana]